MAWLASQIKWIMLVSGALTCTMLYAAFAPEAAVTSTFGAPLEGSVEAQFDVLVTSLRAYRDGLIDGSFKATAFVLLVLGWLLTSKEARAYLAGSQRVRRLAALALGLGTLVYATISWCAYLHSQSVFTQLAALDYVPLSAYADQRIAAATLAVFVAQNVILTWLTCHLVLTTHSRDQGAP